MALPDSAQNDVMRQLMPAFIEPLDGGHIAVGLIVPNPHQPRQHFDEEGLNELAASIREMGVLQPVLVQPAGADGKYQLVAGERRWRASRRAGKSTITHLVARLYDVADGAVRVGGLDVRDATLDSLEDAVGYVTQDAHLFHDTIANNLRYAKPDATDDELIAAESRDRVGLADRKSVV